MKICKVRKCDAKVHAREMCDTHYRRYIRLGTTKIKSSEEKFWDRVLRLEPEACWLWQGNVCSKGYGRYNYGDKRYFAHRFSYLLKFRDIPDGLVLDHLCRNTICVNPGHLEAVTSRENTARGVWKSKTSGLPTGVKKNGKKYMALKRFNGLGQVYISTFKTAEEAEVAYETAIGVLI